MRLNNFLSFDSVLKLSRAEDWAELSLFFWRGLESRALWVWWSHVSKKCLSTFGPFLPQVNFSSKNVYPSIRSTLGMITRTFLQVVLHLTKVIENFMVISLKFFAGRCKTSFNLDLKTWGNFVCFDVMVVGASSLSPKAKLITTNCKKNISKLKLVSHIPAKISKKLLR